MANLSGGGICGFFLIIFIVGTLRIWSYTISHPGWADPKPPERNCAPCDDTNWSAGSAFFTLTALAFGYIAHPRRCMIFDCSGRTWRLSPLFAMVETFLLWKRIIRSAFGRPSPSFHIVCHALMAVRVGNSWHPSEIAETLEPEQRRDDEAEEGRLLPHGTEDHPQVSLEAHHEPSIDVGDTLPAANEVDDFINETFGTSDIRLRPSITWPRSASSEAIPLESRSNVAIPRPEQGATPAMPTPLTPRQKEAGFSAMRDKIIKKQLEEVAKFEHGPSYRIFIWIPIVLQVIKLLVVSGSGSLLTQLSGWVYFTSWATIEVVMITIAQRPLNTAEHISAVSLCQQWINPLKRPTESTLSGDRKYEYKDDSPIPKIPRVSGYVFAGILALYNSYLTLALLFHDFSVSDSHIGTPHGFLGSAGFFIRNLALWAGGLLVLALTGLLVAFPAPMLLAQGVLILLWRGLGRATGLDLGPLWFERYSMELGPLWPAYIAMYNFVILMLFHTGISWWQPFQCWETRKPAFYDWLG